MSYVFTQGLHGFSMQGCPIRESPGQIVSISPERFVADYALLRLQVPRHPPCALPNLTTLRHFYNASHKETLKESRQGIVQLLVLFSLTLRPQAKPANGDDHAKCSSLFARVISIGFTPMGLSKKLLLLLSMQFSRCTAPHDP